MKRFLLIIATFISITYVAAQPSIQILIPSNQFYGTVDCYPTYPVFGMLNIASISNVTSTDSITVNVQRVGGSGSQPNLPQIEKLVNGVNISFPGPMPNDDYQITICATADGITDCQQVNMGIGLIEDDMDCFPDNFVKTTVKRKDLINIYLVDNDNTTKCNINGSNLRQLASGFFPNATNKPITNILRQASSGNLIVDNSNAGYYNETNQYYQSSPNIDYLYQLSTNQKYNIRDTFSYISSNAGNRIIDKNNMDRNYYPQYCGFNTICGFNDTAIAYISIDTIIENLVGNCYIDVNNDNQLNNFVNPFYAEPVLPNVNVTLFQTNETQITNLSNLFSGNVLNNTFAFNDLALNNYSIQVDYDTALYELKPGFNLNNIILTNLPIINGERVFNIPFILKNATPVFKSIAVFSSNPLTCINNTIQADINLINLGNTVSNNTVKLKFNSLMTNIVCSPMPNNIDVLNNEYTWDFAKLSIGSLTQIDVSYSISNPLNHIGAIVNVNATSVVKDTFNVFKDSVVTTSSNQIRCAYDPNDKQVNVGVLTPNDIAIGNDLIYTIRFQNTGNAPATDVIIADVLSSNLDIKSFQFLASSHLVSSVLLSSSNELKFVFNGINLPDSVSNEPASHGYIIFKIKPQNTLIVGDSISNEASIYFDNNPAIITNTVVTKTAVPTDIKSNKLQTFKIYPNPARNYFTITLDNKTSNQFVIQLINVAGKIEKEVNVNSNTAVLQNIELKGMYIVRIIDKSTNEIVGVNKILFE